MDKFLKTFCDAGSDPGFRNSKDLNVTAASEPRTPSGP